MFGFYIKLLMEMLKLECVLNPTHIAELLHTQLIFNHKVCCSCSTDRTHAIVMAVFNYIHASICFFRFSPLNW